MKCEIHKNYSGQRSPRTDCPTCWELYNAQRNNKVKVDLESTPSPPSISAVIDTPAMLDEQASIVDVQPKAKRVSKKHPKIDLLDKEKLDKLYHNLFIYFKIPPIRTDAYMQRFEGLIRASIDKMSAVYKGLGTRQIIEHVILVIQAAIDEKEITFEDKTRGSAKQDL